MEDLTRLIISHERIENIKNNNLELSKEEAHYLNKVMRIKNGKEIFIANGKGALWKAIKVKNDCLEIIKLTKNININQGLVPKVLSKINPIIVPTATAETSSVLNLNAVPIGEGSFFLL